MDSFFSSYIVFFSSVRELSSVSSSVVYRSARNNVDEMAYPAGTCLQVSFWPSFNRTHGFTTSTILAYISYEKQESTRNFGREMANRFALGQYLQ
jgi:hypothetical protein